MILRLLTIARHPSNAIASQLQSFDTTIAKHPSNAPPRDFSPPDVRDSSWTYVVLRMTCYTLPCSDLEMEYQGGVLVYIMLWIHLPGVTDVYAVRWIGNSRVHAEYVTRNV
jgi:hypothetical protein